MALKCGKRLKRVRNSFARFEMAQEFDKLLKCVQNDVDICEMVKICGKCLINLRTG